MSTTPSPVPAPAEPKPPVEPVIPQQDGYDKRGNVPPQRVR